MKRLIVVFIAAVSLAACSSDVNVDKTSNPGACAQERTTKFLGITVKRSQNIVTCNGGQ